MTGSLGADAVPVAQQAARELAAGDEAWREVSLGVSDEDAPLGGRAGGPR